jgi:hypothetical protein
MKTGTTYIQLELLRKKRWNRIYKKLLLDDYEVITQEYDPRVFETVIKECLNKGDEDGGCNYQLWQDLTDLYSSAKTWNGKRHILQSLETFSLIPKPFNDFTKQLFHSLTENYNVRIVVFYRRLYEWILSMYSQYRKHYIVRTRALDDPWKQDYQDIDNIKTLPEWLEDIVQQNAFHYTTFTYDEFGKIFGEEKVTILDYHTHEKGELEIEFFCRGIPNATNGCNEATLIAQEQKDDPNKIVRRNSQKYLLDHDLLIIEAHRQNLVTQGRYNATLILDKKLQRMNMPITQLPRTCVSSTRQEWLQKIAENADTRFSSSPLESEAFRNHANIFVNKMCSVDAPAVLENNTWRELFSSCDFQIEGCIQHE